MRLIDADALISEINDRIEATIKWGVHAIVDRDMETKIRAEQAVATFCEASLTAKKMPTIEERKTGRWIHDGCDYPHGIDWCHCSICGNRDSMNSIYTQVDVYPYCAKCGAKMEVEE